MAGYIFGAGTGAATPEALAARRRWAQAMIHSGTERTPQDPWEGLASLARAISGSYSNFKADQEEAENRRAAGGRFDDLFQPKDMVVAAPYSPGGQTGYRALANTMPKPNEKGVQFKGRMLNDPDLNLTPAMADGFIGNFDVETGGFKHMQEIRPIVPGSRGGLGWAMWTGPRRVAMEAWAKRNGLDPGSDDASYGFWKHEMLNTPEGRRVLGALHGVDDPAKAAEIVSSEYLRPGIPHLDRRVAAARRYAGQSAGGAPPVSLAQAGGPSLGDMLQVYSDPWISPEQKNILQIYIDRELKKADPKT
ncbi:MAG: phage tail tip lysozyme [Pseudomonadota bacterium]